MRLLHITATHLNLTGGIPVVLKELVEAQNLVEGFESRVLSLKAPVAQMNSKYFDELKEEKLERYLDKFNPEIIILHSFYYAEYNSVVKSIVKRNIPYLIEPHGSFGKNAMKKGKLKKIIANNTIFRKQIKKAKGFVFLNTNEMNDSVYRSQYDIVIPNGIDIRDISYGVKEIKEHNFYFIGRYDIVHKGLDILLDALSLLDNEHCHMKVVFWGKGSEQDTKYIKDKIKGFTHITVQCNEPLYGKDKEETLEQIGPMLLTSRYEGLPMTILEAWSYGNPCIVTPGTNMSEEIVENNLGWTTSLDAHSIAECIKQAQYEYEMNSNKYIRNCKKYVAEHYLWSKIAKMSFDKLYGIINE